MNREIREHPLTIPKAGQLALLQDPNTLKTHSFLLDPFLPSGAPVDIEWVSSEAAAGDYDMSTIRTYQGDIYRSEIDDNLDIPGTSANWTLLNKSYSLQMWQAGVYTDERVFVFYEFDNEGFKSTWLFELATEVGRPVESSNFLNELENGIWKRVNKKILLQLFVVFPDDLVAPVDPDEINLVDISKFPDSSVLINGDIDQSIFVRVLYSNTTDSCLLTLTTTVDNVDIIFISTLLNRELFDGRWQEGATIPTFNCATAGVYMFRMSFPSNQLVFEKISGPFVQI